MLNKINALLGKICVQSRLRYDIAIEVPTVYGKVKFDFERTSTPAMPPLEETGWLVIRKDAKALAQLIVGCGGTLSLSLVVDVDTKHGVRRVSFDEVVEIIQGSTVNTSKFTGVTGETPITHDKGIRLNPDLLKPTSRRGFSEWGQANHEYLRKATEEAKAKLCRSELAGLSGIQVPDEEYLARRRQLEATPERESVKDNSVKGESEVPVMMDRVFVVGAKSELTDLLNSHPGLGAFNENKLTTQEFLDSKPERYVNLVKAVSRRVNIELELGIDLRGSEYSTKLHLYTGAFLRKGDTVFYPEWAEEGYAAGWISVVFSDALLPAEEYLARRRQLEATPERESVKDNSAEEGSEASDDANYTYIVIDKVAAVKMARDMRHTNLILVNELVLEPDQVGDLAGDCFINLIEDLRAMAAIERNCVKLASRTNDSRLPGDGDTVMYPSWVSGGEVACWNTTTLSGTSSSESLGRVYVMSSFSKAVEEITHLLNPKFTWQDSDETVSVEEIYHEDIFSNLINTVSNVHYLKEFKRSGVTLGYPCKPVSGLLRDGDKILIPHWDEERVAKWRMFTLSEVK